MLYTSATPRTTVHLIGSAKDDTTLCGRGTTSAGGARSWPRWDLSQADLATRQRVVCEKCREVSRAATADLPTDQDEARAHHLAHLAQQITTDLYAVATTDDGAPEEVVSHVQEFLEYAFHLAASRLAAPDDQDVALEMDRHLREMEGGL